MTGLGRTLARAIRNAGRDQGVTLTELLVVVSLLTVVVFAAYMLMDAVNGWVDLIDARNRATEDVRPVMDRVTRELRQATELSDGAGAFDQIQSRLCSFYSDVDHDGAPELVTYRVQGKELFRSVQEPTYAVPPYVPFGVPVEARLMRSLDDATFLGSVFTYYDQSSAPVTGSAKADQVSAVSVRLVTTATAGRKTALVDTSTYVKVRAIHNDID